MSAVCRVRRLWGTWKLTHQFAEKQHSEDERMKIQTDRKQDPAPRPQEPTETREESNFIVNEPFRGCLFAANKKLSAEDWDKLEQTIPQDETLKFVIVGDLNIGSKYAKSFLAVTDKLIYGFDESFDGGFKTHRYEDVKRAYVKRYYGNAMLIFSTDDSGNDYVDLSKESTNFIRFSYKVASLYDAAANFIQSVAAGKDMDEEMRIYV